MHWNHFHSSHNTKGFVMKKERGIQKRGGRKEGLKKRGGWCSGALAWRDLNLKRRCFKSYKRKHEQPRQMSPPDPNSNTQWARTGYPGAHRWHRPTSLRATGRAPHPQAFRIGRSWPQEVWCPKLYIPSSFHVIPPLTNISPPILFCVFFFFLYKKVQMPYFWMGIDSRCK